MKVQNAARFLASVLLSMTVVGCGKQAPPENTAATPPAETAAAPTKGERALALAQDSIIADTHIDTPSKLHRSLPEALGGTLEGTEFDYPRAKAGGLNAAFMSIYTPAVYKDEAGKSYEHANQLIDVVEKMVSSAPDKFAIALTPADVRAHAEQGLVSLPLGMENGSPIEGDLANIEYFHKRGIRYITLAHSLSNRISDSSYDEERQWDGLSDFGAEVVAEMNRLGIMIDISHVSDEAFYDVMAVTKVPAIASHSSARHFTPGFERNMSDEMIEALADNGGVIQINFGSTFITREAREWSDKRSAAAKAFMADNPDVTQDQLAELFAPGFEAENGALPFATIDDVLDHFDHVVALVGIDYVGIGSDYDGVGDSLPTGLKDVAAFPALIEGLIGRGYSDADIKKILGENLLRVWQAVEDYAAAQDAA